MNKQSFHTLLWVIIINIAFAVVEADIVMYLRFLYYPSGFTFPMPAPTEGYMTMAGTEMLRETATIVMLVSIGILAGKKRWEKFAYFMISFGVWDIMFYVWLAVQINWPVTILDWDILFLIPLPWLAPVLAPVVVSATLIFAGLVIIHLNDKNLRFKVPMITWLLCIIGSIIVLITFMIDTQATLYQAVPQPFGYVYFFIGIGLYFIALRFAYKESILKGAEVKSN